MVDRADLLVPNQVLYLLSATNFVSRNPQKQISHSRIKISRKLATMSPARNSDCRIRSRPAGEDEPGRVYPPTSADPPSVIPIVFSCLKKARRSDSTLLSKCCRFAVEPTSIRQQLIDSHPSRCDSGIRDGVTRDFTRARRLQPSPQG